jgi:hypothetical protein
MVAVIGATTAEIMAAGGHDIPAATIRYQHATRERKSAISDALAAMADGRVEPLSPTKGHAGGHDTCGGRPKRRRVGALRECVEPHKPDAPCETPSEQKTKVPW